MNPPRHKLSYVPLRCCQNIWTWLSHEWNFVNKQGYRETGTRLFGWTWNNEP